MMNSEYNSVYVLRNRETGKYIFRYCASSQYHKAIFSSRKRAEEVVKEFEDPSLIDIIEIN